MPRKTKPDRKTGLGHFIKTFLYGNEEQIMEAYLKEASRQYGEMNRWMAHEVLYDTMGMNWEFEDTLFPLITKAGLYQSRVYNRNKLVKDVKFELLRAGAMPDGDEKVARTAELVEQWAGIEDEQIALCWRIKKIHTKVSREVRLQLAADEKDPFEEYDYENKLQE